MHSFSPIMKKRQSREELVHGNRKGFCDLRAHAPGDFLFNKQNEDHQSKSSVTAPLKRYSSSHKVHLLSPIAQMISLY